jgi:mutator protein MutT
MKSGKDFIGVGCGALIINDKNEVLLIKRSTTSRTAPGTWSRPGGEVEFGETLEDAVKREVKEEVGIEVQPLQLLKVSNDIDLAEKKHWIAIGYLVKYISGIPKNMEPEKHDEVKWFSLNSLPENINQYTKESIQIYLSLKRN